MEEIVFVPVSRKWKLTVRKAKRLRLDRFLIGTPIQTAKKAPGSDERRRRGARRPVDPQNAAERLPGQLREEDA